MISVFRKPLQDRERPRFLMVFTRLLAVFVGLHAWSSGLATAQSTAPKAYPISAGDKIGVTVFGQPDLSGETTVDQGGNIRLPVIGDVSAANLTLTELEGSIAQALTQGYVRNPTVIARI